MRILRHLAAFAFVITLPLAAQAAPKRILVFGDSNSWGWIPQATGVPSERYPPEQQWPRVMQGLLGNEYEVVVDALSGRTTDTPDPGAPMTGAALNGSAYLPAAVAAQFPLDLVVIMVGTNDTKAVFKRSPFRIALGAGKLVDIVRSSGAMFGGGWYSYPAPKVLLVAPPPLGKQTVLGEVFEGDVGVERSKGLAEAYRKIAEAAGVSFFDAGSVIQTDGSDGVHFSGETQRKLGEAVTEQVRAILKIDPMIFVQGFHDALYAFDLADARLGGAWPSQPANRGNRREPWHDGHAPFLLARRISATILPGRTGFWITTSSGCRCLTFAESSPPLKMTVGALRAWSALRTG